jgi:hypothetical protein
MLNLAFSLIDDLIAQLSQKSNAPEQEDDEDDDKSHGNFIDALTEMDQ